VSLAGLRLTRTAGGVVEAGVKDWRAEGRA
jgi:hypothetical protein